EEAELNFVEPFRDYQTSVARSALPDRAGAGKRTLGIPGGMEEGAAAAVLEDWVYRKRVARDSVSFALPPSAVDIVPGSLVSLDGAGGVYLVSDVESGLSRRITARRLERATPTPWRPSRL